MEEGSKGGKEERKKKETQIARNRDGRVTVRGWGRVRHFNGYIVLFLQTQKFLEVSYMTMLIYLTLWSHTLKNVNKQELACANHST